MTTRWEALKLARWMVTECALDTGFHAKNARALARALEDVANAYER